MVFVGNIRKSPKASHLKGLDPFLDFCCQGSALTGIREGGKDERPHQLNLRSKRDVLVPPYDLRSRKSCCCLGYPGKNLGFWSFVRDDCFKVLEGLHCFYASSLWPLILISLWKPFGLFVITFVLSGPISVLYLVVVVSRRSTRMPASSSSVTFTTMSSAKLKLVISRPPMLTLTWSSNYSHMILSRKMLKSVSESSFEPVSCAAIEQDCTLGLSMTRMTLALMLFFLILPIRLRAYPIKGLLDVCEEMIEIYILYNIFISRA